MHRRRFATASGAALAGVLAGCQGIVGSDSDRVPDPVDDPPDAVYLPSHVEGMEMAGTARAGRHRFALAYSFPHRFWQVTGGERRAVDVQDDDEIHLMCTVWDAETGTVLPSSDVPFTVEREGETVASRTMWLMLSQNMGMHFGDNVPLEGKGTYEVELDFGPVPARLFGDLHGAVGASTAATLELDYDPDVLDELGFEEFADRAGERDAIEPMEMGMVPTARVAPAEDRPGEPLGSGTVGDAVLEASLLPDPPAGADGSGGYLAVSSLTPYNRYPVPRLAIAASVGDGAGDEKPLEAAIHPEIGLHYGTTVDDFDPNRTLSLAVESASTVARHEGYETAFLETGSVTIEPE